MSNNIEHTMSVITNVSHRFTGLDRAVPEWPGLTHTGKPAVITRVSISHQVTEDGIKDPAVHVTAHALKKDGTPMAQPIDTRFALSSFERGYSKEYTLRKELIEEFGADVAVEAQAVWQKLYG